MSICEFKTKVLYEFQGDPVLERVGEEKEEKTAFLNYRMLKQAALEPLSP